jgi:hypothetical protein
MADEKNPFEALQALMLENLEKVQGATQSYMDMMEKAMRGLPGANDERIATFKAYLERQLQQTATSWRGFCMQRISRKLSAFKPNIFSLS